MEVFLFLKLQPSFFSIMHASVNSQLLISVPIFPPSHFQATAWLLMARLLCKSLPHSLYHSLECWRGEHVFLRCPFLSLMQTLCSPTVLVSAGAKEWETCLYVLSNQYLCLSSSAQACCILIKVPDALGWGLPSGWPSLVQQDSYVTAPGGAAGHLEQLLSPGLCMPGEWREACLTCWLVACLWTLLTWISASMARAVSIGSV